MTPTMPTNPPAVYLAGPEVFLADPLAIADAKKRMCAELGFVGVFPMDSEIETSSEASTPDKARKISLANEALMRRCELLVANCTPFRGVSMDAGTAYEIGYMRALGRPVFGYTNVVGDYAERARAFLTLAQAPWERGAHGAAIEDFGLTENLMIAIAALESGADLVRTKVEPGRELTDLAGFRRCLELARASR
jgi:nucleoside 2-deoxyribosyltransferase